MENTPVSIYLVDDQAMLRAAFRGWIQMSTSFKVVGEGSDAKSAIVDIGRLKPDIVLLDITMPGLSGIDALPAIKDASSKSRVLMMTHHEGETFVQQSLAHGADGYLSKDSDPEELSLAIRSVNQGRPYISPKVARGLVGASSHAGRQNRSGPATITDLSARERQVLLLLAVGKSNKEVARDLGITVGTAKKHRENLQRKLDCHSAAQLARLAIREGLLGA